MATEFPISAKTGPAVQEIDHLINAIIKMGKASNLSEKEIQHMVDGVKRSGQEGVKHVNAINKSLSSLTSIAKIAQNALLGAFALDRILSFGNYLIKITSDFQKYEKLLQNTFGSRSAAFQAFVNIQQQAAKTNFSLRQVTEGYLKLANNGIKPTNAEMTAFFDLTNNAGKQFDQFAEAVNDATRGEFERLKEFFISAHKDGEKVRFTFKNQSYEAQNNAESIKNLLVQLGQLNGVAGSTAAIASTLEGKMSNFGDNIDQLVKSLGSRGEGLIGGFFDLANSALGALNEALNDNIDALDSERIRLNVLVGAITNTNVSEEARKQLIIELNREYPDFLKNLEAEKVTNEQLRDRLENVNDQFFRKIALQTAQERFTDTQKEILDLIDEEVSKRKEIEEIRQGERIFHDDQNEGLTAEQKRKQAIADIEHRIFNVQNERKELQEELTEKLTSYNTALDLFNKENNDYFEGTKNNTKALKDQEAEEQRLFDEHVKRFIFLRDLEQKFSNANKIKETPADFTGIGVMADNILEAAFHKKMEEDKTASTKHNAEEREKIDKEKFDAKVQRMEDEKALQEGLFDFTLSIMNTLAQAQANRNTAEISALEERKNVEIALAGENEAAKDKIRKDYDQKEKAIKKQQAIREQNIAVFQTIINTARAIAAASPNPYLMVLAGVIGAVQLGVIKSQRPNGFATGVYDLDGPGTSTSDSIPAFLSKGEDVVPANRNKKFGFLLKPIIEDDSLNIFDVKHMIDQKIPTEYVSIYRSSAESQIHQALEKQNRLIVNQNKAIENLKQVHINIDEDGFKKWTKEGDNWTNYVNKRYKF